MIPISYPTASEIRGKLPGQPPSVTEADIELMIGEWKARVADAAGVSSAPEESPLAEAIVRRGVRGDALKQLLLNDFHTETPAADAILKQAEDMLRRYDERNKGPLEPGRVNPSLVSNPSRSSLWDRNSFRSVGAPLSEHFDDNW